MLTAARSKGFENARAGLIYVTGTLLRIASVMFRLWLLTDGNRALRGKEVVVCVKSFAV